MRLLAICESPPTTDARHGNGSTLITANVLTRLPESIELDLAWFTDRPVDPPKELLDRCRRAVRLRPRSDLVGLAGIPFTKLPRATWQRSSDSVREVLALMQDDIDAVYLHGLHTFALAPDIRVPFAVHEVDPWSRYWLERAPTRGMLPALYDRMQARRAEQLERAVARVARRYIVVSPADAAELGEAFGTNVIGIPNGIDDRLLQAEPPGESEPRLIGFVGSLDYPPNQQAVHILVRDVLPRVVARVPGARLLIAGRRPTPDVRALAGNGVTVLADVDDVRDIYERASVIAYPGDLGRGAKNTLMEAMSLGRAVVASPAAARGIDRGDHIMIGATPAEIADRIVELFDHPPRRAAVASAGRTYMQSRPTWNDVATTYADVLSSMVAAPSRQ